jgi:hypothetical protein
MPKPIVIKTTKVVHAKKRHHRHGGGHGGIGGLFSKSRLGIMAGAFAVGVLEKQGIMASLPKLPIIGTIGTIGVAAYLLSNGGRNALANDVSVAAFAIAAHELASTGSIIGGDQGVGPMDVGYVAGW